MANSQQQEVINRFKQVESFIDSSPTVLAPPPAGYLDQVQALRSAMGVIDRATADQSSGMVNKTAAQRRTLRQAVRLGQLLPIRKVARILERSVVGMPHLVTLPKKLASTPTLLNVATSTVKDITPYEALFVSKGLPPDFLSSLNQAIQALQQVNAANLAARHARATARGNLQVGIQAAQDAVTLLDIIVRRACDEDPVNGAGALAVWNGIVPPHARADLTASNVVSGTTADVTGNAGNAGNAGDAGNAGNTGSAVSSTPST